MQVGSVTQPAGLVYMVSQCARYEVVAVGIGAGHEKLGHGISHGSLFEVFPQRPPAVVVNLFDGGVGTFKERYVCFEPFGRQAVGYGLNDVLIFHAVEPLDVATIVGEVEQAGCTVARRAEPGYAVDGRALFLPGIFKVEILVGRSVGRRYCIYGAGAEYDAFDGSDRRKKHAGCSLFTVDVHGVVAVFDREFYFDMVDLARCVLPHL